MLSQYVSTAKYDPFLQKTTYGYYRNFSHKTSESLSSSPCVDSPCPPTDYQAILPYHGVQALLDHVRSLPDGHPDKPSSPLGLSRLSNSEKTSKPSRKTGSISRAARTKVQRACVLLDKKYRRDTLSFFTGTVPPFVAQSVTFAQWSDAVDLFKRRLKYHQQQRGVSSDFAGVYEIHPKRSAELGYPVLHLHLAFVGRLPRSHWAFTPSEYQDMWAESWCSVLGIPYVASCWSASTRIERIKKGVGRYLGSYMKKGSSVSLLDTFSDSDIESKLPRNWGLTSDSLTQEIKRGIMHFFGEAAELWKDACRLAVGSREKRIPAPWNPSQIIGGVIFGGISTLFVVEPAPT